MTSETVRLRPLEGPPIVTYANMAVLRPSRRQWGPSRPRGLSCVRDPGRRVPSVHLASRTPGGVFRASFGTEKRLDHVDPAAVRRLLRGRADYSTVVARGDVRRSMVQACTVAGRPIRGSATRSTGPPRRCRPAARPWPRRARPSRVSAQFAGIHDRGARGWRASRDPALEETGRRRVGQGHDRATRKAIERITTPPSATRRRTRPGGGPGKKRMTRKKRKTQQRRPKS